MKHRSVIAALVIVACLWVGCNSAFAGGLVWQTSRATAVAMAKSQGKKILLLAGRENCASTEYMKYTACEWDSPPVPIKSLIEQHFIPLWVNVDMIPSDIDYYGNYAGYAQYYLPLICVIDPNNSNTYLDRTTGIQYDTKGGTQNGLKGFYDRLLRYTSDTPPPYTPPPALIGDGDINNSGKVDVADIILAIQVSSGISTTYKDISADVNSDEKIGIVEAIYALQKTAGLR